MATVNITEYDSEDSTRSWRCDEELDRYSLSSYSNEETQLPMNLTTEQLYSDDDDDGIVVSQSVTAGGGGSSQSPASTPSGIDAPMEGSQLEEGLSQSLLHTVPHVTTVDQSWVLPNADPSTSGFPHPESRPSHLQSEPNLIDPYNGPNDANTSSYSSRQNDVDVSGPRRLVLRQRPPAGSSSTPSYEVVLVSSPAINRSQPTMNVVPMDLSVANDDEMSSEEIHAPRRRQPRILDSQSADAVAASAVELSRSDLMDNAPRRGIRPRFRRRIVELEASEDGDTEALEEVAVATGPEGGYTHRPVPHGTVETVPLGETAISSEVRTEGTVPPGHDYAATAKGVSAAGQTTVDGGDDSDDDSQACIICYEPWTNSGEHRLSSLKCGHLFGQSCILKWLRTNTKCPQCNTKAKKAEVRVIYAKSLRAIDTSERDRALDDLRKEKEFRRKVEMEMAQARLGRRIAEAETKRVREQLRERDELLRQTSSAHQGHPSSSRPALTQCGADTDPGGKYVLDKTLHVSTPGNCRVIAFDKGINALAVSMPTPNQMFPGFGVKKVSAHDLRVTKYIPLHSQAVRALAFNGRSDGVLLTASMDKTVKMTSLKSDAVVQTYRVEAPAWACAWNSTDVNYVYAGLQTGSLLVYDTRRPDAAVHRWENGSAKCPIVAMEFVPKAVDKMFGCSGLLVASLGTVSFWEEEEKGESSTDVNFIPHLLPVDGLCTAVSFDRQTRRCLASFRPGKNHRSTRHEMYELRNTKTSQLNDVTCSPVRTFHGGGTMKVLSRCALYPRPGGNDDDDNHHLLACAGDEATSSVLIWDATTGGQLQKLPAGSTVLDVCPFQFNGLHFLAALTDKQVKLHAWKPSK